MKSVGNHAVNTMTSRTRTSATRPKKQGGHSLLAFSRAIRSLGDARKEAGYAVQSGFAGLKNQIPRRIDRFDDAHCVRSAN